ncbi:MAG: PepSY-associated TM helix domain-containing protein [Candidatus Eisenbacteria bacterium]|uniref:PepSY-associated TM helix domain-containing protein n=1 Tax=Eiseniibacteriota bacterium TaxID=2212470 RepID=A0A956RPZ1_UNCEI|nr:PepSY-associated TM helix domain-containing protein [Candidatus Eisenbacteria bacterium]
MGVFRKVCRWLHRELGYLTVGLTLVYAVSGLAVNHAHQWNANYQHTRSTSRIDPVGTGETPQVTEAVLAALDLGEPIKNTWRAAPDRLQVFVEDATLNVNLLTGEVVREGLVERPVLFELNFLHLNTPKGAWTVVADAYAGILIVLAISGIFLVRGRRGLAGRGGVLMALGFVLPLVYLLLVRS